MFLARTLSWPNNYARLRNNDDAYGTVYMWLINSNPPSATEKVQAGLLSNLLTSILGGHELNILPFCFSFHLNNNFTCFLSPVHIGTLLTSSHTRLVSTYGWQSDVSSCDLQLILSHCLLGWLIVRPYGNFSFFLCGRPTCPMQYCPLFPGCCKKGDASQEPEIRPTNPCSSPRCNQGADRIRLEALKLKIQNTISASQLEG